MKWGEREKEGNEQKTLSRNVRRKVKEISPLLRNVLFTPEITR